mmetsp:Transcript_38770/g.109654  ORF Transcript_38770/g.109654 Transcript_38770/m.109654 type:complete len:169 (+) Transcript_38770:2-508(+)
MDWLVHRDALAPGLLLSCMLCLAMTKIMSDIFQACIKINGLMERDCRVLIDAEEDVQFMERTSSAVNEAHHKKEDVLALLRTIQKKVELFDEKQTIFGVTITSQLRNGWIFTMGALVMQTLWEGIKPVLENMKLEALEGMLANVTSNPSSFGQFVSGLGEHMHIRQSQ